MKIQLDGGEDAVPLPRKRARESGTSDDDGQPQKKRRGVQVSVTLQPQTEEVVSKGSGKASADIAGVSFARIALEREGHDVECFGCRWGFGPVEDPVADPEGHKFWQLFLYLRANASSVELVRQLTEFHKHRIRPNRLCAKRPCPEWTKESIHDHVFVHMYSPHTDRLMMIRDTKLLSMEIKDACVVKLPDGRRVVDRHMIRSYIQMSQRHSQLMKMDPNTGYNPTGSAS